MKINYDMSQEFKAKYKHKIKRCYDNAFELLLTRNVDKVVLGFVTNVNDNLAARHCWCIKDGCIIDSTFGNDEEYIPGVVYNSAYEVEFKDLLFIMKNHRKDLIGYRKEDEDILVAKFESEGKKIILGY